MKRKRKQHGNQKGFALVAAIFFVVAVSTIIPGTMLGMGRQEREMRHYLDQVPMTYTAEGLSDRAVRLISDWVSKKQVFPAADPTTHIVNGSDAVLTGGIEFHHYLLGWFDKASSGFKQRHLAQAPVLANLGITNLEVKEIDYFNDPYTRRYQITVSVKQNASGQGLELAQEYEIKNAQLFDFSVFYNEELEIGAGPSFTLQGPIFSNKNIYLMNDQTSTLKLELMDDYSTTTNPEKYLVHTPAHIFFFLNRALAKNYLADPSSPSYTTYLNGLPPGLQSTNLEMRRFYNLSTGEPYQFPKFYFFTNQSRWGTSITQNKIMMQDHTQQDITLAHPHIQTSQTYLGNDAWGETDPLRAYYLYARKGFYEGFSGSANEMSLSSALDPNALPNVLPNWTYQNPQSDSPVANSSKWVPSSLSQTVAEGASVSAKVLPIGDPAHPHGSHVLIEPITSIFQAGHLGSAFPNGSTCPGYNGGDCNDTDDVRKAKLQTKAIEKGLDLHLRTPDAVNPNYDISLEVAYLWLTGVITNFTPCGPSNLSTCGFSNMHDYRLGISAPSIRLDIGKLVEKLGLLELFTGKPLSQGVIIYIHTYPMRNYSGSDPYNPYKIRFVRLVNADKLPEKGLTIVSNGRVFIEGDYNTYIYPGKSFPPPAAILSDSVGVLSNEWPSHNNFLTDPNLSDRPVGSDVTVNTGLATGFLGSQLSPRYDGSESIFPFDCRNPANLQSHNCELWPGTGYKYRFPMITASQTYFNEARTYNPAFCSTTTWQAGQTKCLSKFINFFVGDCAGTSCNLAPTYVPPPSNPILSSYCGGGFGAANCLYKVVNGFFYVNRNSDYFKAYQATIDYMGWDSLPVDNPGTPQDEGAVPLYVDPNSIPVYLASGTNVSNRDLTKLIPVRPFPGVSFAALGRDRFFNFGGATSCSPTISCAPGPAISCEIQAGITQVCGSYMSCIPASGGESVARCGNNTNECAYGTQITPAPPGCVPVAGKYFNGSPIIDGSSFSKTYFPLYETHYSGGLENLINLQENWDGQTLNVLGTFSAPWKSTELQVNGAPAYWNESYYSAPARNFDFNENLRLESPPYTPLVFSAQRRKWKMRGL